MAKQKKDFSLIVWAFGWLLSLVTAIKKIAARLDAPFEAFDRLGSPEGESTIEKIVQLIKDDYLAEQRKAMVLPPNHYRVHVGYDMPRDKGTLESEFSKDGVSELFYGNYEWQPHPSCAKIDQTPGDRVFLVKHFGRETESEANITEMDKLGYRPATHIEAYAFAKANPELQRKFWIVALGSSAMGVDIRSVAMLFSDSGRRILDHNWFDDRWHAGSRFLFVCK